MPAAVPVTGPGVTGTVVRYAGMPSSHVAPRNVDVWLPPSYGKDPARRYPVLYMHDGQNLFDPATSYGNVDWAVDEAMTDLIAKGAVREAIVVGVWNTSKRRDEYMPQRRRARQRASSTCRARRTSTPRTSSPTATSPSWSRNSSPSSMPRTARCPVAPIRS